MGLSHAQAAEESGQSQGRVCGWWTVVVGMARWYLTTEQEGSFINCDHSSEVMGKAAA